MGEIRKSKEIDKPFKFHCKGCNKLHATEKINTLFYYYKNDRDKTHLRIICANTGYNNVLWLDWRNEKQVEWASQFIPYMVDGDYPAVCEQPEIINMWKEHTGLDEDRVEVHENTPSQEKQIAFMGHLLVEMEDSEIQHELASPMPNRTMPNRWD